MGNQITTFTVEHLPVAQLKPAKYQPDTRTEERFLTILKESLQTNGFWPFAPLIITPKYRVIDGHRRLAAAKEIGMETVPCIVVNDDADSIYGWMNSTARPMTSKEELQAYANGLKKLPAKHKKVIERVIEIGGMDLVIQLASANISPRIIYQAENIARYVNKPSDNEFILKVIEWLVKYRLQYLVRDAISVRHMRWDKLLSFIESDRALFAPELNG